MPPTARQSKSHTTRQACAGYSSAVEDRLCRTVCAYETKCPLRTVASPPQDGLEAAWSWQESCTTHFESAQPWRERSTEGGNG